MASIPFEIEGFYKIIPLRKLRRTPGVIFDAVPMEYLPRVDAIDKVIHTGGALSPNPVGDVDRPWYMHPCQDDNLLVLAGIRHVDIYNLKHRRIETFVVKTDRILHHEDVVFDGPAMLVWPRGVFHRIRSDAEMGSISVNFAVHYVGFNIRNNFNIYDLNTETGAYRVIREGYEDQKSEP